MDIREYQNISEIRTHSWILTQTTHSKTELMNLQTSQ